MSIEPSTDSPKKYPIRTTPSTQMTAPIAFQKKKVFAGAPWIDPVSLEFLNRETQAESPILRADWFLVNVLVAPGMISNSALSAPLIANP